MLPLADIPPVPVLPVLYGLETGPLKPVGRIEGSGVSAERFHGNCHADAVPANAAAKTAEERMLDDQAERK